jgi:hypothetical protein
VLALSGKIEDANSGPLLAACAETPQALLEALDKHSRPDGLERWLTREA